MIVIGKVGKIISGILYEWDSLLKLLKLIISDKPWVKFFTLTNVIGYDCAI